MSTWSATELSDLRWHWGSAYVIQHPQLGVWVAQRKDTREAVRAESAWELHDRIVADYLARPVPRSVAP